MQETGRVEKCHNCLKGNGKRDREREKERGREKEKINERERPHAESVPLGWKRFPDWRQTTDNAFVRQEHSN